MHWCRAKLKAKAAFQPTTIKKGHVDFKLNIDGLEWSFKSENTKDNPDLCLFFENSSILEKQLYRHLPPDYAYLMVNDLLDLCQRAVEEAQRLGMLLVLEIDIVTTEDTLHPTVINLENTVESWQHGTKVTLHEEKCPICLENLQDREWPTRMPCDHVFHQECLCQWMERSERSCPLCKRKIQPRSEEDNGASQWYLSSAFVLYGVQQYGLFGFERNKSPMTCTEPVLRSNNQSIDQPNLCLIL